MDISGWAFFNNQGANGWGLYSPTNTEVETVLNLLFLQHGETATPNDSSSPEKKIILNGSTNFSTLQAKFGTGSMKFFGDGGYGIADPNGNVHPSSFNVGISASVIHDMWIYPTSLPASTPQILVTHERSAPDWWRWALLSNGCVEFRISQAFDDSLFMVTTTPVVLNTWNHVIRAQNAGVSYIGIAGNIENSVPDGTDYDQFQPGSLRVGHAGVSGDPFVGFQDEHRWRSGVHLSDGLGPYTIPTAPSLPA